MQNINWITSFRLLERLVATLRRSNTPDPRHHYTLLLVAVMDSSVSTTNRRNFSCQRMQIRAKTTPALPSSSWKTGSRWWIAPPSTVSTISASPSSTGRKYRHKPIDAETPHHWIWFPAARRFFIAELFWAYYYLRQRLQDILFLDIFLQQL